MTAVLVLAAALTSLAQQPARDRATAVPTGTAVVRGLVVDAATGAPLRGATVGLSAMSDRPFEPTSPRETVAGEDGRFEIAGLTAGDYRLLAYPGELRGGYLPAILGHAEFNPMRREPSFSLADAEIKEVRISLPRGLAIEGRVVDEFGEPMAEVRIETGRKDAPWRQGETETDDRGLFRVFGLEGQPHEVCADPVSNRWSPAGAAQGEAARARYTRTCLPDPVVPHADTPFVVFQLLRTGAFTLSGTLVSDTGADLTWADVMVSRRGPEGRLRTIPSRTVKGRFTAEGLVPGEYVVNAFVRARPDLADHRPIEAGMLSVRIDGGDVRDATILTRPPSRVAGRVVRDPRAVAPLPGHLTVMLAPDADGLSGPRMDPQAVVRDGRFVLERIYGEGVLVVGGLPPGWFVDSVRRGGADITGLSQDFRSGGDAPIEIVVSDRAARLRARAVDGAGAAVRDALVLLVPTDAPAGTELMFRALAEIRTDGDHVVLSAKPGEHRLLAMRDVDLLRAISGGPAAIQALVARAPRVSLAEGDNGAMDVRVLERRPLP